MTAALLSSYSQVPEATGFVEKVMVPLLCMRAMGSISVEWAASPSKIMSGARAASEMRWKRLFCVCRPEHLALAPGKQGYEEDNKAHSP